ncbi:hypothetical protein BCR44DRAFT_1328197 [Catenaria anguillulae PL171]|uniref:Uncharacterized protein n=1 Tax=Catenaria anguillulae PL171 TaxID=765915 RepID=A0A1Y2H8B1_9FUNG|nr:hypothetical protein BCR44DRAFT_1328197 [Catenaria anguillulae PL171]
MNYGVLAPFSYDRHSRIDEHEAWGAKELGNMSSSHEYSTIREQTFALLALWRQQVAHDASMDGAQPFTDHLRSFMKALIRRDVILRRHGMRGDIASGTFNEITNRAKVRAIALSLLENGASTLSEKTSKPKKRISGMLLRFPFATNHVSLT